MESHQNPSIVLQSGGNLPILGLGTYQMRGAECTNAICHALENGYTHIDTASIYKNQTDINQALTKLNYPRNKLFITSKIGPYQQGYQQSRKAAIGIIQRMNCQYLDLLLIHWPGSSRCAVTSKRNRQARLETWKTMIELQKEGLVKDIGVSNFITRHLVDLIEQSGVKPAVNQFEVHPLLWDEETITYCREKGIIIEAYSPLAQARPELLNHPVVMALSKNHKKSPAQICLRWSLQHGFVVLPKTKNSKRVVQNLRIFDFKLSETEMEQLNALGKTGLRVCWDPNAITQ